MADIKELAENRSALLHFDPRKLQVKPGLNARDMQTEEIQAHIEWLAGNIAVNGVRSPLEIFRDGDDVFVSHGHCRLAATMLAIERGTDVRTVPCVPEPRGTNDFDRILSQNIDNTGKPLTLLEAGANIKRAVALGKTIAEVAEKLGRSESYVSQALDFQAAPAEVHAAVKEGQISATLAAQVVREEGPLLAPETIKEAVKVAKASGKKKATAKHLRPLKAKKQEPAQRQPWEVICAPMPAGEYRVTFGDRPIIMPRNKWAETVKKIAAELGIELEDAE